VTPGQTGGMPISDPAKPPFTGSPASTAIDSANGNVVGTIKPDGNFEFAVSDGSGEIFANSVD
jgi:hypothetical protein